MSTKIKALLVALASVALTFVGTGSASAHTESADYNFSNYSLSDTAITVRWELYNGDLYDDTSSIGEASGESYNTNGFSEPRAYLVPPSHCVRSRADMFNDAGYQKADGSTWNWTAWTPVSAATYPNGKWFDSQTHHYLPNTGYKLTQVQVEHGSHFGPNCS